jgi:hypothetical protein
MNFVCVHRTTLEMCKTWLFYHRSRSVTAESLMYTELNHDDGEFQSNHFYDGLHLRSISHFWLAKGQKGMIYGYVLSQHPVIGRSWRLASMFCVWPARTKTTFLPDHADMAIGTQFKYKHPRMHGKSNYERCLPTARRFANCFDSIQSDLSNVVD